MQLDNMIDQNRYTLQRTCICCVVANKPPEKV